jgi:DNA (cytosine-5)-methyltransferase 3A
LDNITVLSLFDGMSGGQLALQKLGITIKKYNSSEINPYSIKITQKNFPNTIQLGDVTQLNKDKIDSLGKIDLMIFGSPCENLSITVINNEQHNQGLDGEKRINFFKHPTQLSFFFH